MSAENGASHGTSLGDALWRFEDKIKEAAEQCPVEVIKYEVFPNARWCLLVTQAA